MSKARDGEVLRFVFFVGGQLISQRTHGFFKLKIAESGTHEVG